MYGIRVYTSGKCTGLSTTHQPEVWRCKYRTPAGSLHV